jgi:hypothetical protein
MLVCRPHGRTSGDAGKQVAGWKCQPGTITAKFLPGSVPHVIDSIHSTLA